MRFNSIIAFEGYREIIIQEFLVDSSPDDIRITRRNFVKVRSIGVGHSLRFRNLPRSRGFGETLHGRVSRKETIAVVRFFGRIACSRTVLSKTRRNDRLIASM